MADKDAELAERLKKAGYTNEGIDELLSIVHKRIDEDEKQNITRYIIKEKRG